MSILKDEIFANRDVLPVETLKKYHLKSLEDIVQDLVDYSSWDLSQPMATIALLLKEGKVDQCVPTILGESDPKRVDARTIFGDDYKGGNDHQIKIGKVELQRFRFRGSLVSDWLSPQEFSFTVQRPSTAQTGVWRDINPSKVEADGGQPLWLRAILQPWTGLKLKLTIGVFAAKDATKEQDSEHPRFPIITLVTTSIPIFPFPPENTRVCLPFVPFLIGDEQEEEDDSNIPRWNNLVKAVNGLLRDNTAPHCKSNMENLKEALKGDWKADKRSKYAYPVFEFDDNDDEDEQDGAGMHIGEAKSFDVAGGMS